MIRKYMIFKIFFKIFKVRRPIGLNPTDNLWRHCLWLAWTIKKEVSFYGSWGVGKKSYNTRYSRTALVAQWMRYHDNTFCAKFEKCVFELEFSKVSNDSTAPNLNLAFLNTWYEKRPNLEALSETHYTAFVVWLGSRSQKSIHLPHILHMFSN